jgi:hypothetical protein
MPTLPIDRQHLSDASTDRLLDAAHNIIPREARLSAAGERNGRQVLILEALLRAAAATARGIADNTQEDRSPLVGSAARNLTELTNAITTAITDASNPQHGDAWGAPASTQGFGMPSMSGEELV